MSRRKEYENAERFLHQLAKRLELDPHESFFVVPGNHDVDRSLIGPADRHTFVALTSSESVEEVLDDDDTMIFLGRRLETFYAFTERLQGTARGWQPKRPWRVDVRNVGGVAIAVLQLNSAWASGPDDQTEELLLGELQLREALAEAGDAFVKIVLVHHPLTDLRPFDQRRLSSLLPASGIHFLLRGHRHETETVEMRTPDGSLLELAAGAAYTGGRWPRGHLLTEVDLTAGEGRTHLFTYSESGEGFWTKDVTSYEKASEGVWTFPLSGGLKLDADVSVQGAELSDARWATLAARYRSAVAAVHGSVRFVGLADHRPRQNVQVPELFVPLRLRARERYGSDKDDKDVTTDDLLRRLLGGLSAQRPARFVVLGDPGSGKTTLCRFAAVVLSGEAKCGDVQLREEIVPLFLPFRDYVRVDRERDGGCSILAYLADQASAQLQVRADESFLEKAIDDGRAVLLLDGMDEVGSAQERESMRERVQAFCRVHEKLAVLVTSRVAGYDDAPLSQAGTAAFDHLVLAPFDDEDQRDFARSWYDVQEPADAQARDRGVADLMAALEADPHVRALARNPMMATLIALVHRFDAHLPGERAALYDICVRTLLETWPASKKRTFSEIDARLQRTYLEALAYRMQCSRESHARDVTIEREALVETLVEIVRERAGTSQPPEMTRGLVERWILFLEVGTGLLVEQRPNVFAFFHLSLMEYLAARGMDQMSESLADAIVEHYDDAGWRDVCLLAVGSKATEKVFLDQLFTKIHDKAYGWSFLLHCLREEAAFDDEQRTSVVRGAGQDLLRISPTNWSSDQSVLEGVSRFSIRHAEWAREWVDHEIGLAEDEDLRGIVALRHHKGEELVRRLGNRKDAGLVADHLLEFWPGSPVADWAVTQATTRGLFDEGRTTAAEIVVLRSIAAARLCNGLAAGLSVGLLRAVGNMTSFAHTQASKLAERDRPGGRGLPSVVRLESRQLLFVTRPMLSICVDISGSHSFNQDFDRFFVEGSLVDFLQDVVRCSEEHAVQYYVDLFEADYEDYIEQYLTLSFAHKIIGYFEGISSQHFAQCFSRDFVQDFTQYFTIYFGLNLEKSVHLDLDETSKVSLPSPACGSPPPDAVAWCAARVAQQNEDFKHHMSTAFLRLAFEGWIAMITMVEASDEERTLYVYRRVQNAWLLQVWDTVDEWFGDDPTPDVLALYMALGYCQATTTWQWPTTKRWKSLFEGSSPEPWLPRAMWHLCYLLHAMNSPDIDDSEFRRAVDEAIDEGLRDAERPWVAEALRELIPKAS